MEKVTFTGDYFEDYEINLKLKMMFQRLFELVGFELAK
jgi:hypothetical protein